MFIENPLNSSALAFPILECCHILGFAVSIGTIAVVDFSLLGWGLERRSAARLLRDTAPWTLTALVLVLLAGAILFLTDPLHYYYNSSFRFKIIALILAIAFNYTIHRKVASSDSASPLASITVGSVSLILWVSVVASGLFIGFVSQTTGPSASS